MRLELHPEARAELRSAALWYDERRPGLGEEFIAEVSRPSIELATPCGSRGPAASPAWMEDYSPPATTANAFVATLQWLGIVPSFSRPHVCNDNPYCEALFHTPASPRLPFASSNAARRWVAPFVSWYNAEQHHSAIRYVTPDQRHAGADVAILARRQVDERAQQRRADRWSARIHNWTPVGAVLLNPELSGDGLHAAS